LLGQIKCYESKILTYNAQFNFCCHYLAPRPVAANRSIFARAIASTFPGAVTVPSFSIETPESNFQRSAVPPGFRATKNPTPSPTFGLWVGARSFFSENRIRPGIGLSGQS
jgi:hypothetical protein